MTDIAGILYLKRYILRSGGAEGADTAFERGVDIVVSAGLIGKEIYVPWKGFRNNHKDDITEIRITAFVIAQGIHPNWKGLSDGAKKLHARDIHQVLGRDLKTPSKFLICWTMNGEDIGGTRTAIKCARNNKIPVYNLGNIGYGQLTSHQLVDRILSEL
jgi:hypothetical protein